MTPKQFRLIVSLIVAIFGAPPVLDAQQSGRVPRIGVTLAGSPSSAVADALRRGLTELGWVEGQNVLIEYRYAEGKPDRYQTLVAELIGSKVDVIVAGGGEPAVRAAKEATSTIPIVMPAASDPVAAGLVSSLARPGGNVTGLSMQDTDISAKRLELLRELLPKVERVAVLRSTTTDPGRVRAVETSSRALGLRLQVLGAGRPEEFAGALDVARKARAEALIVFPSSLFNNHRRRLVDLVMKHRLVAIYEHRNFPDAGGLMSYGPNLEEMYRSAARYVDKILKGAKPADLPVEQPTAFDLVINLKTAKALGLTIPQSLLLRATHLVE